MAENTRETSSLKLSRLEIIRIAEWLKDYEGLLDNDPLVSIGLTRSMCVCLVGHKASNNPIVLDFPRDYHTDTQGDIKWLLNLRYGKMGQ